MLLTSSTTAFLLIGFQNDYFAVQGALHKALEDPDQVTQTLRNTISLIDRVASTDALVVATPIVFTPDYSELCEPVGILKVIKETGAFRGGTSGSQTVPEFARFGSRILEVPGKRGLNAFSNTRLDDILRERNIRDVVICGVVASLCIDSTGRAAHERNYRVWFPADCISGRTKVEHRFYLSEVYPLYSGVVTSEDVVKALVG